MQPYYDTKTTGRSSVWLERTVRDRKVGGSNPLAPTCLTVIPCNESTGWLDSNWPGLFHISPSPCGSSARREPLIAMLHQTTTSSLWCKYCQTEQPGEAFEVCRIVGTKVYRRLKCKRCKQAR